DTPSGVQRVRELGLDCLEMAWVNGVRMGADAAARIARAARENDVHLTAHAPYYVNLCGEPAIVERSRRRLREAARLGVACGARSVCFHAGFYQAQARDVAAARVLAELQRLRAELGEEGLSIDVRPELTGKPTQVGSLDEILEWSRAVVGVRPCIDFAHQHARTGAYNSHAEFCSILEDVQARLGTPRLRPMHVHVAGARARVGAGVGSRGRARPRAAARVRQGRAGVLAGAARLRRRGVAGDEKPAHGERRALPAARLEAIMMEVSPPWPAHER